MASVLRVLLFAAVSPLLLRLVRIDRLGGWLEPGRSRPADPAKLDPLVRRVDRAIRLGWPLVRRGCLVRGMTLYRFLRGAGFEVSLVFGMGQPPEEGPESGLTGHCWIELDGRPLAEKRDPRPIYAETYRIAPRAGRKEAPAAARAARAETA